MASQYEREQRQLYFTEVQASASSKVSDQPPVILLHGLFGQLSNLSALAKALQGDYRVIRADLRNHGRSPHWHSMSLQEMAGDVRRLLDELDISKATILGHSLGGKVAMQFAFDHPDRVSKLIVADIAPVVYPPHHDEIISGLQAIDLRSIQNRGQADKTLQGFDDNVGVRQFLLTNLAKDEQGNWFWKMNLEAIDLCYEQIRAAPEQGVFQGETLFIKGELSDYILLEHQPIILTMFPQAQSRVIQGASHWLHAEKPQAFNLAVKTFLEGGEF